MSDSDDDAITNPISTRVGPASEVSASTALVDELKSQLAYSRRELDGLLYAISHDLRAPLRAISGFSQALIEDCADETDSTAHHHLDRIRESTQRLNGMFDGLLTLARQSQMELELLQVDINVLAQEAHQLIARQYPHLHPDFITAGPMPAYGDPRALRLVLQYLLDNAWKCSADRSPACIECGMESIDGVPAFYVRDNGVGFDMAYVHKLFIPFQRLHARAELSGNGLGLACAQRIIARHGGRIWAESVPDTTTTFHFTLGTKATSTQAAHP